MTICVSLSHSWGLRRPVQETSCQNQSCCKSFHLPLTSFCHKWQSRRQIMDSIVAEEHSWATRSYRLFVFDLQKRSYQISPLSPCPPLKKKYDEQFCRRWIGYEDLETESHFPSKPAANDSCQSFFFFYPSLFECYGGVKRINAFLNQERITWSDSGKQELKQIGCKIKLW